MPGLIFDCDGVLTDSEGAFHLEAFNQVWVELGIPWRWTIEEYRNLVHIAGGRERLASLKDNPLFRKQVPIPEDERDWNALVTQWHRRKTQIYVERINRESPTTRPGIVRLARSALASGWRIGVASSGSAEAVSTVTAGALGPDLSKELAILSGDSAPRKKPAPDLYLAMARTMALRPSQCVVIEDAPNGLAAARAAGMACVVTPTDLTRSMTFDDASMIVSCLGDPGGEPSVRLAANKPLMQPWITISDLEGLVGRYE
jgi:HAD superfamily hydrolase (TIGR01509 family)